MDRTPRIVVIGSINMDVTFYVDALPRSNETLIAHDRKAGIGGKGLNQAMALARLGCETAFVAATGDDAYGRHAQEHLKAAGISTMHLRSFPEHPTGTAHIFVAHDGQNMIVVSPGANAHLTPADIEAREALIANADAVVVQLEIPLATVQRALELARKHGVRTLLNPAPVVEGARDLIPLADFLTPNETELAHLTGIENTGDEALREALSDLAEAQQVVVTLGSDGCAALVDNALIRVPAYPVQAVDATGAGDVFNGALIASIIRQESLPEALRFAVAAAALSVSCVSANAAPSFAEVYAFLDGR